MSAVERLQSAIDKLEQLRASSQNWRVPVSADEDGPQVIHDFDTEGYGPGSGSLAWTVSEDAAENIVLLHRTIDAQLAILAYGVTLTGRVPDEILSLADAILGGA